MAKHSSGFKKWGHVWTARIWQGLLGSDGEVESGQVSGLCVRYHLTAGLDGFRGPGPIQVYALRIHTVLGA